MWYVLGAVALVAVIVAAISVLRRPSHEDMNSLRHYHTALGTLEHLSERTPRPSQPGSGPADDTSAGSDPNGDTTAGATPARATPTGDTTAADTTAGASPTGVTPGADLPGEPDSPAAGGRQPRFYSRSDGTVAQPRAVAARVDTGGVSRTVPRSSRPLTPPSGAGRSDPPRPLVFDDVHPSVEGRPSGDAQPPLDVPPGPSVAARSRMDRAQRHALDSMNHRPHRGLAAVVVVVVLVLLFGVLAVVGSRRSHHTSSGTAAAPTRNAVPHASPHAARKTTTTAPQQLVAQSSTSATALYSVGSNAYTVAVAASGPCWVDATAPMTGSTLWTGTMQGGAVQQIQGSGVTRMEFGTLAIALKVDGVPVVIPTTIHSPFVVTFEPAAAGPTGSSTTVPFG